MLLVDFKSFVVLFFIGSFLGALLAYTTPTTYLIHLDQTYHVDYFGIMVTYLVSLVIGGIFAHNREKIEQAKLETMKSLGASVAHELRTPLSAIQVGINGVKEYFPLLVDGYVIAKENGLKVQPIQPKHLQILSNMFNRIESETRYSNIIINMILMNVKQHRISADKFKIYSMNACIEEAIRRYPFKHGEAELVEWCIKEDFLFQGDEMFMVHVLFNLIKNSLYYIEAARKGKIQIWSDNTQEYENILYFKDTASGIPTNVLPKLFERFYTTTRHGTGLGLAYCKMVLTSFGGTIQCKSQYGEFTQFEMVFPKITNIKTDP